MHRLLTTRGVDERMPEMLKNKTRLFDAYARRSAVAESTPDAADVDPSTWDTSKGLGPNDANVQKVYDMLPAYRRLLRDNPAEAKRLIALPLNERAKEFRRITLNGEG
ncbi:hypothetical protein OG509_24220 [Streptomyces sp. NBC_01006]|nr:hypothetical protein OG509_24220 [Streptomyces sp. NBC_01006]